VLVLLTERAVDVLSADVAAVGLADAGGTSVTVDVVAGDLTCELFGTTIPAAAWRLDEVLHQGRSVVVADLGSSGLHPSLADLGSIGPCLAVPLWGRLRPFGVLLAGRERGAPPFPDRAVKDLQGLSRS
jgi:GAF domain-containing protein